MEIVQNKVDKLGLEGIKVLGWDKEVIHALFVDD